MTSGNDRRATSPSGPWSIEEKIALTCRMLAAQGHSETLAGQVTVRGPAGTFLTTSEERGFDEIHPEHIIRIDGDLNVVAGAGAVNTATRFHLWIYRARPDVNCIVHTHPPFVSALSMAGRPLCVAHMDATPFADDCAFLAEWPGLPTGDEEGEIIARALGTKRSLLLAHHGFLCATGSVEESAYLSLLIELAARNQLRAEALGPVRELDPVMAKEAHDFLLLPFIVQDTFALHARRLLRREREER